MRIRRETYVTTLARLYYYSTSSFSGRTFLNLLDTDCAYTYASFRKQCDALSKTLCQYGIGSGDRIAVLSPSMPNWVVAMFATVAFGRVFVPIFHFQERLLSGVCSGSAIDLNTGEISTFGSKQGNNLCFLIQPPPIQF